MRARRGDQAPDRSPPPFPAASTAVRAQPEDASPSQLGARAREVLAQIQDLERELLFHRTLRLHRIEAMTGSLDRLQAEIAGALVLRCRPGELIELRAARRCVADALVVTLDLLERLRPPETGS